VKRAGLPDRYGTIVVVGGGCYGSYYVRQLGRAADAGAIVWERLVAVDRDPACKVATTPELLGSRGGSPGVEVVVGEWPAFFDEYLGATADGTRADRRDAIVPSPLMPHLMVHWLVARARARWPSRSVALRPLAHDPPMPWQRAGDDGTHYVSFATWMCPVNCIEPATCPHTRGPRDWSMPPALTAYVDAERARGEPIEAPILFHCVHRSHGVGMFDTGDVVGADRRIRDVAGDRAAEFLVGSVSHCHGALARLVIAA
jgi:hypothetical protein